MKRWAALSLIGMALTTVGCGGAYVRGFYASTSPPPVQAEFYGTAPGPGYVWIQGYWTQQSGRYAWVPGRWDRPPRGYSRWESGRWDRRGDRYEWREGRWRR